MFGQMEIYEQVYEGGTLSKKTIRENANRYSHVRKRK